MKTKPPILLVTIDDEDAERMRPVFDKLSAACSGMIMLSFISPGDMARDYFLDHVVTMVKKGHAFELSPPKGAR